jgi:hypothetical protein
MTALRTVTQQMKRMNTTAWVVGVALLAVLAGGQAGVMASKMARPPAEEFGLGPRASASKTYLAMIFIDEPLQKRKLQTMQVVITDRDGHPVDGATIAIDGGMPQHGHGLPTQPRVSNALGGGEYEIEGVRFNMGGWWEFKLIITSPAGTDIVTFNLAL